MALNLHDDEEHESNERWLLTYSDLITLLMIFFIVMYAMSNVNTEKYSKLAQSLNSALAGDMQSIDGAKEGTLVEKLDKNIPTVSAEEKAETSDEELEKVAAMVIALLKEKGLEDQASVNITDRGVVISLKDIVLFESGSAEIKPENSGTLIEIGSLIKVVNNYVRIEGNTDNVPIQNSIYSNNWDLSVMRASKVLDLIVTQSQYPPEKISAIGYGEYRPQGPNGTDEEKSENRRVDIVILKSDLNKTEST
ncbi:MAG TPA: flagellar motor protein MotB [Acetobacterium sp.]